MLTTDFYASLQDREQRDIAALKFQRGEILRSLRAVGVACVVGTYDAYGDSGNVEDISLSPAEIHPSDAMRARLDRFIWAFVYQLHPGFENNDGGYGELRWDIVKKHD